MADVVEVEKEQTPDPNELEIGPSDEWMTAQKGRVEQAFATKIICFEGGAVESDPQEKFDSRVEKAPSTGGFVVDEAVIQASLAEARHAYDTTENVSEPQSIVHNVDGKALLTASPGVVDTEEADAALAEAQRLALVEARPALVAATEALGCLSKNMLTELKSFASPPHGVNLVTAVCLILLEHEYKDLTWPRAKKMISNVGQFIAKLQAYHPEEMTESEVRKIEPLLADELFNVTVMRTKSMAAANLCNWAINIHAANRIHARVKLLTIQLEAARALKAAGECTGMAPSDERETPMTGPVLKKCFTEPMTPPKRTGRAADYAHVKPRLFSPTTASLHHQYTGRRHSDPLGRGRGAPSPGPQSPSRARFSTSLCDININALASPSHAAASVGGADVYEEKSKEKALFERARDSVRHHRPAGHALRLIQANPSVTCFHDGIGWTLLHYAAKYDRQMWIDVIVGHGADINARNNMGSTPLNIACRERKAAFARALARQGNCDPAIHNEYGHDSLFYARHVGGGLARELKTLYEESMISVK